MTVCRWQIKQFISPTSHALKTHMLTHEVKRAQSNGLLQGMKAGHQNTSEGRQQVMNVCCLGMLQASGHVAHLPNQDKCWLLDTGLRVAGTGPQGFFFLGIITMQEVVNGNDDSYNACDGFPGSCSQSRVD